MMRLILVCLLALCPFSVLANDGEPKPTAAPAEASVSDSSGRVEIQAVLDTFAAAWLAGDRETLERVLHEDYTYFTSLDEDANSWGRDTEVDFACRMAETGSVASARVTATEVSGAENGEVSVAARWDVRLAASAEETESSTEVRFTLKRDEAGALRMWRQVQTSSTAPRG